MPTPQLARNTFFAAFLILSSLLYGCGGGGGAAQSGILFDPAAKYQGNSTQAVVSADNAEALAMGGLAGQGFGAAIADIGNAKAVAASPVSVRGVPALPLAQDLKAFVRQLSIHKNAARLRTNTKTAVRGGTAKTAAFTNSFQVAGPGGGSATYSLQVNNQTGSFYGTVTCNGFTSNSIVIDGTCDVLGTFDLNLQEISQISMSFKSLSVTTATHSYTLVGSLSWSFAYASSLENLTMNLVVKDGNGSKTYWFKNYSISTVYGTQSLSQTISGRYYDYDHGYVEVVTTVPLVVVYGSQWPYQGTVSISTTGGKSVTVTFHLTTYDIKADADGDGAVDWQVERPGNDTPPVNVAPVADAGPDQTVSQWNRVRLDASGSSDANEDVLSYYWYFTATPSGGGATALTGFNTSTPSFVPQSAGTYQLRVRVYDGYYSSEDTVTVTVAPAAPTHPDAVKQTWEFGAYGSRIGTAGLYSTDLDGDGTPEIIASASAGGFGDNVMWYVVRKNASGGYDQVWRSEIYGVTIARILLADMNGDSKSDVAVALNDGSIRYYDGPTLNEISRVTVAAGLRDLAIADLDGDGSKELVTTDGVAVRVYAASDGTLKWSKDSYGGSSIAVGNVDGDSGKEIVTASYGGKGYVLDASGTVKWEYVNGFGGKVRLADLDTDGRDEIIGASSWYKITIFDADIKTPAWEITTDLDIDAVVVADSDEDGVPEIIYGDRQMGKIHAIDARTHLQKWTVSNTSSGVSGIAVADVDLDGKKELLWGGGGNSTGADYLFVANPATGSIEWHSADFSGLSPLALGDLNNDGGDQLLMITKSSNSGYDGGIINIFDPQSHVLSTQRPLGLSDWLGDQRVVRIGDLNGDGRSEFALSTSNTYDAFIQVYDGATRTLLGKTPSYDGNYFSAMVLGDVDGDGKPEIVAGQGREHTGAKGVYLVVFDGSTFSEKWKSVDLGNYWGEVYDLKLADLDKDGHIDIIASLAGSRLIVYDGVTHAQKLMVESPARAIDVADVDNDGNLEILVGRTDGLIDVLDGVSFAIKETVSTYSVSAVDALKVADLDGNGSGEWLVAGGGILTVLDGQSLYWRSDYLGQNLGDANSIAVKDLGHDGRTDIFIGSDTVLYHFEYSKTGI